MAPAVVTKETDRQYCSFRLPGMIPVQYRRVTPGLKNANSTFQKIMNIVLSGLSFEVCCCYLDEILVWSRDMLEHRQLIFDRLRSAGLMLHPEKCDFAKTETKFLGYILSPDSIRLDSGKTTKIINFPRPASVKEARIFYNLALWLKEICASLQ